MYTTTRLKVLLIDSSEDFRTIFTVLLELAGCEVNSACCADIGLQIAADSNPDVIITELASNYPFDVARVIRSKQETKDAYLIALTSIYWKGIEYQASQAGFDRYLLKPIVFESLMQILTEIPMSSSKKLALTNIVICNAPSLVDTGC